MMREILLAAVFSGLALLFIAVTLAIYRRNMARRATRAMLGLTLCEMSNQIRKIPCPLGRFLRLAADLVEVFHAVSRRGSRGILAVP